MDKQPDKEKILQGILEANEKLNSYETPETFEVNIETEEDRNFWFMMRLHGYIE